MSRVPLFQHVGRPRAEHRNGEHEKKNKDKKYKKKTENDIKWPLIAEGIEE